MRRYDPRGSGRVDGLVIEWLLARGVVASVLVTTMFGMSTARKALADQLGRNLAGVTAEVIPPDSNQYDCGASRATIPEASKAPLMST